MRTLPSLAELPVSFLLAVAIAFGLLFGSFLNVVIHRLPRGENIAYPGSRCPGCGKPIAPRDNVPVFSWLLLRDAPGRTVPTTSLMSRLVANARLPITWQACILYAVAFGGYVAFSVYLPAYLKTEYALSPAGAANRMAGFVVVAVIFVSATLLGFASHSPGGLGVFDAAMLVGLWQMDREDLLAGMLLFRVLYYLAPFVISVILLTFREVMIGTRMKRLRQATPGLDAGAAREAAYVRERRDKGV